MRRHSRIPGRVAALAFAPCLVILASAAVEAHSRPAADRLTAVPTGRPAEPSRTASIFDYAGRMDANSLDMVVTNRGSFGHDITGTRGGLVYPKGGTRTILFAAGIWIAAEVAGEIRTAIGEYAQEFTPGPMANGTFLPDDARFRNYRIVRGDVTSEDYLNWPAADGAPLDASEKPLLLGDVTMWSVYNDADPARHVVFPDGAPPLGVEIQQTTFAYNRAGALGNMIFLKFRIANKGIHRLDRAQFGLWSDPDLGGFTDDLVGCDTTLSLGYCYNATNADQQYGSRPPAVGFTLLQGPRVEVSPGVFARQGLGSFVKYLNGTDPETAVQAYRRMQGLDLDGNAVHVRDDPSQPVTRYEVSGDPVTGTGWLDSNPADRRMISSCGPFTMAPGDVQEIVFAVAVGQGNDRLSSVSALRAIVPVAHLVWKSLTPLAAAVDVDPDVINLVSRAPWVTVSLSSEDFDVAAIDPATLRLAGTVPAASGTGVVGDRDGDGTTELVVKFSRALLDALLTPGVHTLEVTGRLITGEEFQGSDEVRVIDPGRPGLLVVPNPLNPTGTIVFRTDAHGAATVTLHDVRGRRLRTLLEAASLPSGPHRLDFDGRGANGGPLASGVYLVRVVTAAGQQAGRVVVLK